MDVILPVHTEGDLLHAVAAVHEAACRLKLAEADRGRVMAAALQGAVRGRRTHGSVALHSEAGGALEVLFQPGDGPPERLAALPIPAQGPTDGDCADSPALWEDLSKLLTRSAEGTEALEESRRTIAGLQNELDETNRGVMALYAELDDRADKLRRADELKSRFLSYASHELRTPLNGIVGLVRLLRSAGTERSAEDTKQLAFIQKAAEEMREMVNDLLDLAKVEAGKVTVQPSEFDLGFVFGALRGIFRPLLQTEDVTLIFEDTSAVPSIYSDEAKVSQILRNLLSNALKFTERGTVKVWATAEGDTVRIVVSDTGIGIPASELPHIFEEFRQVDNPLQRRVRGTGLGLPLCQKFAELLGGRLMAESTPGKGSKFTLVLPRSYPVGPHHGRGEEKPKPRARATLLIVDDIEIDRYLLSHLITAGGDYDIIQAEDGQAGLNVARREHPDLIFLDVNLPLMDGFAVALELGRDPATSDIPIIAVTAEKLSQPDYERLRSLTRGIILKENLSEAQRVNIDLTAPVQVTLV
jgi:signal transduction histidine kinase